VWPFKWKLLSSSFLWCCLLCCTRWLYLLLSLWIESYGVTIQVKATEYRPFLLCCLLCCTRCYWEVLSFGAVYHDFQIGSHSKAWDEILKHGVQMKATDQYFPVVLFIKCCTKWIYDLWVCRWNCICYNSYETIFLSYTICSFRFVHRA